MVLVCHAFVLWYKVIYSISLGVNKHKMVFKPSNVSPPVTQLREMKGNNIFDLLQDLGIILHFQKREKKGND